MFHRLAGILSAVGDDTVAVLCKTQLCGNHGDGLQIQCVAGEMLKGADATLKVAANPEEAIARIYSNIAPDQQFKVYARHPYCYTFNY